jgi:hypothetical protein
MSPPPAIRLPPRIRPPPLIRPPPRIGHPPRIRPPPAMRPSPTIRLRNPSRRASQPRLPAWLEPPRRRAGLHRRASGPSRHRASHQAGRPPHRPPHRAHRRRPHPSLPPRLCRSLPPRAAWCPEAPPAHLLGAPTARRRLAPLRSGVTPRPSPRQPSPRQPPPRQPPLPRPPPQRAARSARGNPPHRLPQPWLLRRLRLLPLRLLLRVGRVPAVRRVRPALRATRPRHRLPGAPWPSEGTPLGPRGPG